MDTRELEIVSNRLKGVAGILLMISQSPDDSLVWREWVFDLLYEEVKESVEKIREIQKM